MQRIFLVPAATRSTARTLARVRPTSVPSIEMMTSSSSSAGEKAKMIDPGRAASSAAFAEAFASAVALSAAAFASVAEDFLAALAIFLNLLRDVFGSFFCRFAQFAQRGEKFCFPFGYLSRRDLVQVLAESLPERTDAFARQSLRSLAVSGAVHRAYFLEQLELKHSSKGRELRESARDAGNMKWFLSMVFRRKRSRPLPHRSPERRQGRACPNRPT